MTPGDDLDIETAGAILRRWSRDLLLHLETTYDVARLVHPFDTLVVRPGSLGTSPFYQPQIVALCEPILIWQALSQCPGFSFRENLQFWAQVVSGSNPLSAPVCMQTNPFARSTASRPFPIVVFTWDRLKNHDDQMALDFFRGVPESPQFHEDMELIRSSSRSGDYNQAVDCVLRFRLAQMKLTSN